MRFLCSALHLLFLRVPVILFRAAGIARVTGRAKRRFRRALADYDLPDDVVEVLVEHFDPSTPLRETLFRFSRR
ncbi:hypothetical protein, conserved [Thermococcus onnurineus NA1]|uniref:Uncharacterized protein n=1 Tax=Thermococcus onnurineus (strain NA1) TaxID=523850 RepID=B6YX28_THEON|nr:hypothetical protein [Thermococcus onnurineus]ACJ16641.1 hypothetical protein, conserved [Thermococcus onnurineus NA1]